MPSSNPLVSKRQFYLDIARAVAIISITLNHAVNRSYANYDGQMAEFYSIPLLSTLFKTFITIFSHIGVPLFLMITGVLILNKRMESAEDIKRFYKHNLLSLLITTEVWYVLIYWYYVLFSGDNMVLETRGLFGAILGMVETMLFQNQLTFGSMWYMPMILCLYTTLPFVIIVKDKLSGSKLTPIVFLPAVIVFLNNMVHPVVNVLLYAHDMTTYTSALQMSDLCSYFYIYILIGYFVGKGVLAKWRTCYVAGLAALTFVLTCGFQLYVYAQPFDYLVDYNFPLLPVCAGLLFELFRRGAHRARKLERPVTYLSRIAFAVYFMHMVIMSTLNCDTVDAIMRYAVWNPALKLLFLETVSVGGSVVIIALLSKIGIFRKYLFMIK